MIKGFWQEIERPVFVLAPMADVTDSAFRQIITKYGKPDVIWTEFVSADGLFLGGRDVLLKDLEYTESERPIVAQFFSSRPDLMEKAARLAVELGFDGIDINMGCPDRSICKQGAGASMIKNPELAEDIILATKRGAESGEIKIPVSVKTRLGYSKDELEEWLPRILKTEPAVVTVHARTKNDMSKVPARWDRIRRAVEIRDEMKSESLILGNGDLFDIENARKEVSLSGADGAMLGRAIFGNPWLWSERKDVSIKERLEVLAEHTHLFEKLLTGHKNFALMKKHYKAYVSGWDGAKELRGQLMDCEDAKSVENVIQKYLKRSI